MVMWEEKWTLKLAWGAACGATASERAPSRWRMPHLEPRFGIIILPETRAATQTKKAAEKWLTFSNFSMVRASIPPHL
jgi:hypothetical protein